MNLAVLVGDRADATPDKPAIDGWRQSFTYGELSQCVHRLARGLAREGVRSGDVVGVNMLDTGFHIAALLAVARVGAVILPLDWRASKQETGATIAQFQPRLVIADEGRQLPDGVKPFSIEDLTTGPAETGSAAELTDAPLVYALTSGTTGERKAMVVTHEEMFERFVVFAQEDIMRPDDRFLPAAPLAYAAGREFIFSLLLCGATIVLAPPMFDASELAETVRRKRVDVLLASPNITRDFLAVQTDPKSRLLEQLRLYVSTTGRLTSEERAAVRTRLAPRVIDFYGSTGSGPIAVISSAADEPAPNSAGHIASGLAVEIVDDEGLRVREGEIGWIRMRGPRITKRFALAGSSDSEGPRDDGWYYPGDIASIGHDGILHLHGRSADLIKRGGLMVHAQEVERILMLNAAVVEAAVLGIPSPNLGEEVAAFVVARSPIDPRALSMHCVRHLAPYKVPTIINIVDALPRNASGKVQKTLLRDSHGSASSRRSV